MRNKLFAVAVGAFVAALAAGCAKPPAADVEAAKAALAAAETAEAATYAADAYKAAQDAQAQLEAELKVQEDKFALFRSYTEATELAASAKTAAEHAGQTAATEKDRIRTETTQLIADAKVALEEAKQLLAKAPRGKGSPADIAAMTADLATAETSLTEADTALATDHLMDARNKAEAGFETARQVKAAVEQAEAMRARPRG